MVKLPLDYIAGFVDGEGCFSLKFRRDFKQNRKNSPEYFYWSCEFAIVLKSTDSELLKMIKNTIGYGKISFTKDASQVRYSIQDAQVLKNIIVPLFKQNRLYGKKWNDFLLWSEALSIIYKTKKKHVNVRSGVSGFTKTEWNAKDLNRLKDIYKEMIVIKGSKPWKWVK